MVGVGQRPHDTEPSPDFDRRCMDIIHAWERGKLPFKESIAQLELLSQEAVTTNHIANQGRAEHLMGYLQHYRGHLNTSIRHYERSRSLYMQAGNLRRVALVDLNQGENYRFKGDFTRARRLYHSAYETARELGDLRSQTIASLNEGLVLLAVGQMASARDALNEALRLTDYWTDKLDDLPAIWCEAFYGLAVVHLSEGRLDEAWGDALRSLEAAQQSSQPMQIGYANRTMGEVVTHLDSVPEGFSVDPDVYFNVALEAFKEVNAEAELARTMYSQAQSMAVRGRKTAAARKFQQVMIMFTQLGMVDDAARAAQAQLDTLR